MKVMLNWNMWFWIVCSLLNDLCKAWTFICKYASSTKFFIGVKRVFTSKVLSNLGYNTKPFFYLSTIAIICYYIILVIGSCKKTCMYIVAWITYVVNELMVIFHTKIPESTGFAWDIFCCLCREIKLQISPYYLNHVNYAIFKGLLVITI